MENQANSLPITEVAKALEMAISNLMTKRKPFDVEKMAYLLASVDSAKYFMEEMPMATNFVTKRPLLDFALEEAGVDGLFLEFGVFRGTSISHIAKRVEREVFGFDSFEGLPEDWTHFQKKGRFSLQGKLPPNLPQNVTLVKGWFDATIPEFLENQPGPVSFLHIDCDIYSSAKTVLTLLKDRIHSGTVILFDEYFNYPGWQKHEARAFEEFIEETGQRFEFLGFASSQFAVGVKIL
jgi:hypothetical protein